MIGWYYLHTNGDLIYKRELGDTAADIRESDFARALWPMVPNDRAGVWRILVEALAAGANKERVFELAKKWHCDDADCAVYADHVGANLFRDGSAMCATRTDFQNQQESPIGFGDTALEAMAELARELGYKPAPMWGNTFPELLKEEVST